MKKSFLISALFLVSLVAKTQQYYPFPVSNARWIESVGWFEIGWDQTCYLKNDTTIDNKTYNKVYHIYDHSQHDTLNGTYLGCIREDSLKRVYFLPSTENPIDCIVPSTNELLLYDFNVKIGDTITYFIDTLEYYDTLRYLYNVITGIDSIEIKNEIRKRIEFSSYETLGSLIKTGYWIEGIGSTLGLLSPIQYSDCGPGAFTSELICYFEDESLLFSSWDSVYCSTVQIDKIFSKDNLLKIYPNPTNGLISIELNKKKQSTIRVFNIVGTEIIRKELNQESIIIDISFLQNGLYIFNVHVDNENYNFKIVKE